MTLVTILPNLHHRSVDHPAEFRRRALNTRLVQDVQKALCEKEVHFEEARADRRSEEI